MIWKEPETTPGAMPTSLRVEAWMIPAAKPATRNSSGVAKAF